MPLNRIATCRNLEEYFKQAVNSALSNQKIETDDMTAYYLVRVLIHFARAENFFSDQGDGPAIRPLAQRLADAQFADNARKRCEALRNLGDFALFFAGFFAAHLNRKAVDVDYYIGMGGGAYATLHSEGAFVSQNLMFSELFLELSRKFTDFVDVLAEIGEDRDQFSSGDVLRVYELWLRTGSKRAAKQLRRLGIEPNTQVNFSAYRH